jgi:hypothetical protein
LKAGKQNNKITKNNKPNSNRETKKAENGEKTLQQGVAGSSASHQIFRCKLAPSISSFLAFLFFDVVWLPKSKLDLSKTATK